MGGRFARAVAVLIASVLAWRGSESWLGRIALLAVGLLALNLFYGIFVDRDGRLDDLARYTSR